MVANAYNWIFNSLIHLVGNSVDDQQVFRLGDPNKTGSNDPTHSQLAKDHDNHPFHTLAASLAKSAVKQVGEAMAARWWNQDATADPSSIAAAFIVHPNDSNWQDAYVKNWALTHASQVKRGESATEWEALEKEHKRDVIAAINRVDKKNRLLWNYINENFEIIFNGNNQIKK